MGISDSKLSYHLGILKEQGLIKGEQRRNWIIYSLTDRGRRALRCTEHMEARKGRRRFLKNNVVSGGRVRGNQGKKKK